MTPLRIPGVVAGLLLAFPLGTGAELVLIDGWADYGCDAGTVSTQRRVAGSATETCDSLVDHGSLGTTQHVVEVTVTFSLPPQIDVQVDATSFPPDHCATCGPAADASGWITMQYQVALRESAPLPTLIPFDYVPVSYTARAQVSSDDPRDTEATVSVPGSQVGFYAPPSFHETVTAKMIPDQVYDVRMSVSAFSFTVPPASWSSNHQAVADPVFELDQQTFDETMELWGAETFPLADYFELAYSANLVPEPSPTLLGAFALLSLALLRLALERSRRADVARSSRTSVSTAAE